MAWRSRDPLPSQAGIAGPPGAGDRVRKQANLIAAQEAYLKFLETYLRR
jgi:hypothetical protein